MAKTNNVEFVPTNWGLARTCADGLKVDTYNDKPSLTDQSGVDSADINIIMATYTRTGYLPGQNKQAMWGDFFDAGMTLQQAISMVEDANKAFMTLPANIRAMADNDPAIFLDMLQDEGALAALKAAGFDQVQTVVTPKDTGEKAPAAPAADGATSGVTQTN